MNYLSKHIRKPIRRRSFLKGTIAGSATLFFGGCDPRTREAFLQEHYLKMDNREKKRVLARLEAEYRDIYGVRIKVGDTPPIEGASFVYALDLSLCIGCRRCVYACMGENNLSRAPQIHYIQVLEMKREKGIDLEGANLHYSHKLVPKEGYTYMPVACQQCRNPPCVRACPTKATWQEPDGVIVVDYNWCIGCRYCMAACPYNARKYNWGEPNIPSKELNANTEYLGNRPRYKGVVEKCTFCIQRVRNGRYPACVEICPVGARKFGNLLDPNGEIRYIIENKRVFVLKSELNTQPRFYYYYSR